MRALPLRFCLEPLIGRARPVRVLTAALLFLALFARPAAAQLPLTPGAWSLFEWLLGAGPVDGGGFLLDATERTRVRVTDAGVTGDAFDILVDGVPRGATPSVPGGGGGFTGLFDGDAAWAEPALSKGELFLDPGQYLVTLVVRETAPGVDFGEGFIRADAAPLAPPTPGVVPEPTALASLAGGLAALALAGLVRRRTRAVR